MEPPAEAGTWAHRLRVRFPAAFDFDYRLQGKQRIDGFPTKAFSRAGFCGLREKRNAVKTANAGATRTARNPQTRMQMPKPLRATSGHMKWRSTFETLRLI